MIGKPRIEEVFEAFQELQGKSIRLGSKKTAEIIAEMIAAQNHFKARMEDFGLADYIDWSGWEDE